MDHIINTARMISRKFILCENAYANTELVKLAQLLLQTPKLQRNQDIPLLVDKIIKAHEVKNYIYIADLIEYELIPTLLKTL